MKLNKSIAIYYIVLYNNTKKGDKNMLIQMKEIKTKTYPLDKGFFLDIVTNCKYYEAWLYHKDYGIKDMMFGVAKDECTYEDFLDYVEANIPDYEIGYRQGYMRI